MVHLKQELNGECPWNQASKHCGNPQIFSRHTIIYLNRRRNLCYTISSIECPMSSFLSSWTRKRWRTGHRNNVCLVPWFNWGAVHITILWDLGYYPGHHSCRDPIFKGILGHKSWPRGHSARLRLGWHLLTPKLIQCGPILYNMRRINVINDRT